MGWRHLEDGEHRAACVWSFSFDGESLECRKRDSSLSNTFPKERNVKEILLLVFLPPIHSLTFYILELKISSQIHLQARLFERGSSLCVTFTITHKALIGSSHLPVALTPILFKPYAFDLCSISSSLFFLSILLFIPITS